MLPAQLRDGADGGQASVGLGERLGDDRDVTVGGTTGSSANRRRSCVGPRETRFDVWEYFDDGGYPAHREQNDEAERRVAK